MRLELDPAAEAEAREAYRYYLDADESVATRFQSSLDEALERISRSPGVWPAYFNGTQRLLLRRFPFAVIYRVGAERILVVAISHQKRHPGYWRRRGRMA